MSVSARLLFEQFEPGAMLGRFNAALPGSVGGVVSFVGRVRAVDGDGGPVAGLFLEHHPRMTQQSLDSIATDGAARFAVEAVEVAHRCGAVGAGEAVVWVAVGAAHRREAFEAADYLMDRLKTDAVFWKREERPDGAAWIEPTARDQADRARWEGGEWRE